MYKRLLSSCFSVIMIVLLIIDTKTAVGGARDGIELCLNTVIPSLLPFFIASNYFLTQLGSKLSKFSRPVLQYCGIPQGAESIFLLGILGGYPLGASIISEAYQRGELNRLSASKLLGFCNNAGPSFIFAMAAYLFSSPLVGLIAWLLQITSALIVGRLFHAPTDEVCHLYNGKPISFIDCVEKSIKNMIHICGWIIIFRVLIAYIDRFTYNIPENLLKIYLIGMLEMTNGCIQLVKIESDVLKFLCYNAFLSLGGFCVYLQTKNCTKNLSHYYCINGSFLKHEISTILSVISAPILFKNDCVTLLPILSAYIILLTFHILLLKRKITVANRLKIVYN